MNRKAQAKHDRKTVEQEKAREMLEADRRKANPVHPYDDIENWLRGDFQTPPWSPAEIKACQDRLDSAFGAENAIVLAWSGDRRYGDVFLNEEGEEERKPPLLFAEIPVNDKDYIYVSAPRWLLLEVIHGSQLEDSWEEASFVKNEHGIKMRIRPERPPQYMYQHLKIIAEHEIPALISELPPCCARMLSQNKICYGKYRVPSDQDIAFVRSIRENMDRAGVAQRNDQARSQKVLNDGAASTRHFIQRAEQQQAMRVKEIMLANTDKFMADIIEKTGCTKTYKEIQNIVEGALEQQDEARFV